MAPSPNDAAPPDAPPSATSAASPEESREHPRFDLTAYVDYTGSEVLLYHQIENISLGGMSMRSSAIEEVGTRVELLIAFPELKASVALEGEVVWVNREAPMDMGIRFVDLDESRKDVLRRHLQAVREHRR